MEKKAKLSVNQLIFLIVAGVLIIVIVISAPKLGIADFIKNFFPDFNQTNRDNNDLIVPATILKIPTKVLLNDGEGRCVVYKEENSEIKDYGVYQDKLWKLENGNWKDVDDEAASSEQINLREIKDKLNEKKDNLVLFYDSDGDGKEEEYAMEFGFKIHYSKYKSEGLISTIDGKTYLYSPKEDYVLVYRDENNVPYTEIYTNDNLKNSFKNSFIKDENKLSYNEKKIVLVIDFDNSDKIDRKNRPILRGAFDRQFYGIGPTKQFYYLENPVNNEDWYIFEGNFFKENENQYLYNDNLWNKLKNQEQIKSDLMRECYED